MLPASPAAAPIPERRRSLLVVVQRYGDVAGGAEAHARMLVNRLRAHYDIEVATTTARDYWTWENAFTAGLTWVDDIRVRRFPVEKRRARLFHSYERRAFRDGHALADEHAFLDAQGPVAPELLEHLDRHGDEYDHLLFFQYLYWPTVRGLPLVPARAVLVPTAHDEPALRLSIYRRVFHLPRAIAYNTDEERALVHRRFANQRVPSDVVGVGVDVPADLSGDGSQAQLSGPDADHALPRSAVDGAVTISGPRRPARASEALRARADRFRGARALVGAVFLYIGRIVESKGCRELFENWARWRSFSDQPATLVLIGHQEMRIPERGDIRYLGRTSDEEKWDALAACAALVMPSQLESLSLATIEAWAIGRPTICSARSTVLASMTRRAVGGLAYRTGAEFGEICELLAERPALGAALGASGRAFVERTYTWPAVIEKYHDLLAEVRARNS